jgi:hypothetical protein
MVRIVVLFEVLCFTVHMYFDVNVGPWSVMVLGYNGRHNFQADSKLK